MRHFSLAFVVYIVLVASSAIVVGGEPAAPPELPAFAKEAEKIRKQVESVEYDRFATWFEANKDEWSSKRETLFRELREDIRKQEREKVQAVLKLIEPNAAEPEATELLAWIIRRSAGSENAEIAVRLLEQHHLVEEPTILLSLSYCRGLHVWAEDLLAKQYASPELPEKYRGKVLRSLAINRQKMGEASQFFQHHSGDDLALYIQAYGKKRVEVIRSMDTAKLDAEAIKLFEELREKYDDIEIIPGLTAGQLAESSIFEIQHLRVGKVAPEINGKDLNDKSIELSSYRGKVVLLAFWASWCGPCMESIPKEKELVEKYQWRPFAIVGVNGDPKRESGLEVEKSESLAWRSFWNGPDGPVGPITKQWNINAWPTTYVIDHHGIIRGKNLDGNTLEKLLTKVVAEAESN